MLVKKLVVGPLRITFLFTFFWWSKHFRFAMEMLSDTVCAVPSSLTHRYCLLFLFLCQTLPFTFIKLCLLSNPAPSAVHLPSVLLFCRTFASVVPLFCHTLSIIALHGKLVQKNPLKAWLRMAVHNGSITVLVIKPSGRVMKIYLHFIDYTFPHILPQPPRWVCWSLEVLATLTRKCWLSTENSGDEETYLTVLHRLPVIRNFQMCKLWLKLLIHAIEKLDC